MNEHVLGSYKLKLRSYDYFKINRGSTRKLFRGHGDNHDKCPGLRALSETKQICRGLSAVPHLMIFVLLVISGAPGEGDVPLLY
jgi:hypothetical protein